ncbi:hypothetical protein IAT38_006636 [Cryptococcus sp. DSM 104549]
MLLPSLLSLVMLAASTSAQQSTPRVLVYTATAGYRHDSIPTAIEVLGNVAGQYGVEFQFSEDKSLFTNETLSGFDGIMFVSNSEEVLDESGQAALQTFFQSGGAFAGVHSASACLWNDTSFGKAIGAYFDYHPEIQTATFERLNTTHPSTANVPDLWTFEEEVYYFRNDPRSNGAVVLLTVNESTYDNTGTSTGNYPSMGTPHPIAWYIDAIESAEPLADGASKAGRSFYTSLGHLNSTWQNETFIGHVMEGLKWALDGASTKAYGVGLVGNGTASASAGNSTDATGTGDGTTASGSASESSSASGTAGSSAAATTSSAQSGGIAQWGGSGVVATVGAGIVALGVGMGLVL